MTDQTTPIPWGQMISNTVLHTFPGQVEHVTIGGHLEVCSTCLYINVSGCTFVLSPASSPLFEIKDGQTNFTPASIDRLIQFGANTSPAHKCEPHFPQPAVPLAPEPLTIDTIIGGYLNDCHERSWAHPGTEAEWEAEARAVLAARDRETAAKALREAASRIGGDRGPRGGVRMADEVEWAQWLNARATSIGAGDE